MSLLSVTTAKGQDFMLLFHILNLLGSFADFSFKAVGPAGVTKHIHNASKIRLMA